MATARARFIYEARDKTKAATKSVRKNVKSVETGMARIQKSAERTSRAVRKSFRQAEVSLGKLGARAKRVGRDLALRVTAPIAAMGVGIFKVAGDFEAAMNRVQVKTQATGDQFTRLREQAKQLGASTQFSARQAAEGQEVLATAGFKAEQILASLPGVLNLAAAGGLELGDAASYASGVINGFTLNADQAGRVSDILAKGMTLADQSVGDLGEGMRKVAGVAGAMGYQVEDTAAALSVLAQSGRRAEEGGTALLGFMQELNNPASKAVQLIERMGLSLREADGSFKSTAEIIDTFAAAGITAANAGDVFNRRTATTFTLLAKGQGNLVAWRKELEAAGGTAEEIAQANMRGFRGELIKLRSALEGVAIAIADSGLLAWGTQLAQTLAGMAQRLSEVNPRFLRIGTLIALAAAAVGPLILALGALASSFSALAGVPALLSSVGATVGALVGALTAGPVLLAVGALVAGVVALVDAWRSGEEWIRKVADLLNTVASDISATLEPVLRIVAQIFTKLLLPALKTVGEAVITSLAVAFRIVATVIRVTLGPVLEKLAEWVGQVIPKVVDFAVKAWDGFVRFVRLAAAKLLETLAAVLGFLGKLPGELGQGFRDGAAKLQEFAVAVGDLSKPVAAAVAEVDSFGESLGGAGDEAGDLTPWDALLRKIRELTAATGEVKPPEVKPADETGDGGTVEEDPTSKPRRALLNLKALGQSVSQSLEQNLGQAILNLRNPIQAVTEAFKAVWQAAINEVARQLGIRLAGKLLGIFSGFGPLSFLAGNQAANLTDGGSPSVGADLTLGQSPAPGSVTYVQNNYSLLPGQTVDRVRAGRVVTTVNRQRDRFIMGRPAVSAA